MPGTNSVKYLGLHVDSRRHPDLVDLAEKGFFPTSVVPLLSGDRKRKINSFYIRIQKVGSFADVYHLETILCLRVQVRAFNSKPGPSQCFQCQRFGHSSAFCKMPPRCVRCGEAHNENCPVVKPQPATCCNCGGSHPANFRGCNHFKKALKKQQRSKTVRLNLLALLLGPRSERQSNHTPRHLRLFLRHLPLGELYLTLQRSLRRSLWPLEA